MVALLGKEILEALGQFGPVHAIKLYRLSLDDHPVRVPTLPCLDHEAKLHEAIDPHLSVYLEERSTGELHEVAVTPSKRRIDVDLVSTMGEHSDGSHERLLAALKQRFPDYRIEVHGPSWWRGERRVAAACRAQVTLREVLLDNDFERTARRINRLQVVSTLMEKQSRVASWGVRTLTAPVLAAAGAISFQFLGVFIGDIGADAVNTLRYAVLGVLGAVFLYYGLKAVQLTEMANRAWKRSAEYSLILAGRKRLSGR
ncbi:MAG: hypothetical protein AB7P99_04075 [Vicinamibacterales bacterium]